MAQSLYQQTNKCKRGEFQSARGITMARSVATASCHRRYIPPLGSRVNASSGGSGATSQAPPRGAPTGGMPPNEPRRPMRNPPLPKMDEAATRCISICTSPLTASGGGRACRWSLSWMGRQRWGPSPLARPSHAAHRLMPRGLRHPFEVGHAASTPPWSCHVARPLAADAVPWTRGGVQRNTHR